MVSVTILAYKHFAIITSIVPCHQAKCSYSECGSFTVLILCSPQTFCVSSLTWFTPFVLIMKMLVPSAMKTNSLISSSSFTVYSWWSSLLSISGKVLIASDIEMFFIFYYFSSTWKKYCNWSEIIVFLGELSVNTTSSTKQLSQVILRDV